MLFAKTNSHLLCYPVTFDSWSVPTGALQHAGGASFMSGHHQMLKALHIAFLSGTLFRSGQIS